MKNTTRILAGLANVFLLSSVASCATFSELYTWFGLRVPLNVDGTLLARESQGGEAKDEPLFNCHVQGSCYVVKTPEFTKIQTNYDKLLIQLRECQGR